MTTTDSLPAVEVPREPVIWVELDDVVSFLKCLGFDDAAEAVEHNDWETSCL